MKKYTVFWVNNYEGSETEHGTFDSYEEASQSIFDWWKSNGFKPPYIRNWEKGNRIVWDYGSHFYFYNIEENEVE